MSRTLVYAGRIPPRTVTCSECGGFGCRIEVVGSRRDLNNNVIPIEREPECEPCEGTGRAACCYCDDRADVLGHDGPVCESCAKEVG